MTSAADFLADQAAQATIERDHVGRYLLPDPDTGERKAWTRATTFARAIADSYGLTVWQLRMAARGLALRSDLVLRLLSEFDDDHIIDECIAQAQEHAGSTVAATSGTAMHRLTELVDADADLPPLPPSALRDITAYTAALKAKELAVLHIERVVCVPALGVAGTLDRVLTHGSQAWIADLKTGADLVHSWAEIAIQLAIYAHGAFMWNLDAQTWEPMPEVDQQTALVVHLPVGRGECNVLAVDIAAGWDAAVSLCGPVRSWRNRGRNLARPLDKLPVVDASPSAAARPPDPVPDTPPASGSRVGWIRGRLRALASDERARNLVAQRWPDGITVRGPWPDAEIDVLAEVIEGVEREVGAPFGASDPAVETERHLAAVPDEPVEHAPPWEITDDGVVAEAENVAALVAEIRSQPEPVQLIVKRWAQQGRRHGRAFDGDPMTRRMWSCARAAIACAKWLLDEDRTRRALAFVLVDDEYLDGEPAVWGETVPPVPDSWLTGAVIGSLDVDQAEALADLATAYAAGNAPHLDPL